MYHIPRATDSKPLENPSLASTIYSGTSTTATTVPGGASSTEPSSTSKAVIGSVISCISAAILIILGVYFYRRRRHKYRIKDLQASFVFRKDVFAKPAPSHEFDKYAMVDLTKLNSKNTLSPVRYHESSSTSTFDDSTIVRSTLSPVRYREPSSTATFDDNTIEHQPQVRSFLDITNTDEDEKMTPPTLTFPKPLAEKKRAPRGKPTWLSPITIKQEVRSSPPPTYGMSSAGQETLIPIIPQGPRPRLPPKSQAIPMSPISPVTRRSYASVKSKQSLIIPDFEMISVVSPARSESFAPKDLVLPPPPTPASFSFAINSTRSRVSLPGVEHDTDMELPRLMNVVAHFTPNLPDELRVNIGDAVRIIEEYRDGWCFVQFLGKKDAPKGMVPLVCLQEKERLTAIGHRSSNKSLTSLNWRTN